MEPPCIKCYAVVNSVVENIQSINNELIHLWMLNVLEAGSWWANSRCGLGHGLIAGEAVKYSFYTFSKQLFQSRNIFPKGLSIVLNSHMKCSGGGEGALRNVLPTSSLPWETVGPFCITLGFGYFHIWPFWWRAVAFIVLKTLIKKSSRLSVIEIFFCASSTVLNSLCVSLCMVSLPYSREISTIIITVFRLKKPRGELVPRSRLGAEF